MRAKYKKLLLFHDDFPEQIYSEECTLLFAYTNCDNALLSILVELVQHSVQDIM